MAQAVLEPYPKYSLSRVLTVSVIFFKKKNLILPGYISGHTLAILEYRGFMGENKGTKLH